MKPTFLFLIGCFLLMNGVLAQPSDEGRKAMKGVKKEVRQYVKTNIFPSIKAQRAKLESQISAEDQQKIADLRQRLKALKEETKDWHGKHKGHWGKHKPHHAENEMPKAEDLSEAEREKMHEAGKKMRRIVLEASVIADNYDKAIQGLLAEIRPQGEKWRTDIKAILEKNMPADMKAKRQEHHGKHEGGFEKHFGKLKKVLRPAGFILLDPNAEMPEMEENEEKEQNPVSITVFPNPSADTNVIRLMTTEKGKITIRLLDKDSQVLKTVFEETREAGEQNISIRVSDLKNGLYYYQINSPSGQEIRRFLKE